MTVYLPTAVVGNDHNLITLGSAGEIMGWFYPAKDHAQHIHECMPCVYVGPAAGRASVVDMGVGMGAASGICGTN